MIYGYCRISTAKQNIDRQIRNIAAAYPTAKIIKEVYTGTKFQGRKELDRLLNRIQPGDTIVFDSVSRMSRDAKEGYELYEELFHQGVHLVFLKEPHINTDTYRDAMETRLNVSLNTGDDDMDQLMKNIIDALNTYILALAQRQIHLAFIQAEKEVTDLRQRTKEGIETAKRNGKHPGRPANKKIITKKQRETIPVLLQHSKTFGGNLGNAEISKLTGVTVRTLTSYKNQLSEEIRSSSFDEVYMRYCKVRTK